MAYSKDKPENGKNGSGDAEQKKGSDNSGLYIASPLFDIAAIPGYGKRLGTAEGGPRVYGSGTAAFEGTTVTPGLATLRWVPTYGTSLNKNSYLNRAADRFLAHMQEVLHQKTLPYQAADVMIVFAALESIHLFWKLGIKGLKAVKTKNDLNNYFKKQFVEACGWDYDDLMLNRIKLFDYMDLVRDDIDVLHLPKTLPIWETHFKMMDHVFADSASDKAQMYVCTPDIVWSYAVVDQLKGLTAVDVPEKLTVVKWITIMDSLLLAVKNSTDFAKMEGDIKTVCEADGFYECESPSLSDSIMVLHDPGFLTALCNCTPYTFDVTSLRITDTRENYLKCEPLVLVDIAHNGAELIPPHRFNTITDKPTAPEMVNYARWHIDVGTRVSAGKYKVASMGTEVFTSFKIVSAPNGSYAPFMNIVDISDNSAVSVNADAYTYAPGKNLHLALGSCVLYPIAMMVAATAFKWHPILWMCVNDEFKADEGYVTYFPLTQWNFGFTYAADDLATTHELLLLNGLTPKS